MTTVIKILMPEGISHDTPAVCLAKLSLVDRLKHHRKELRSIAFLRGIQGATEYKQTHPEASSIRVNIDTLAYSPKPKGYDLYIAKSVEAWLTTDAGLASTNISDVTALNEHFDTNRFNPANHFSKPLSVARLNKLKALFLEHGSDLDIATHNTLSKVKAAAKAARGHRSSDKLFSNVGAISGDQLVIGGRSFTIARNGNRECIRVRINGSIRRMYLDELEWFADLLNGSSGNPLPSITLCNIGDCAYPPEAPISDLPAGGEKGDCDYSPTPDPEQPLSLSDRLAALKPAHPPYSTPCPDGVDPLTLD